MTNHNKNEEQQKHPQQKKENYDVEYKEELADTEDREAVARAKAASQRVGKENI